MEDIASSSQNPLPLPLPQHPLTALPWQQILDNEFVPVVKNQIMGIAHIHASFVKFDNEGNPLFGSEVQSGFVFNGRIVTTAHGLIDYDFSAYGWRIRPIEIISIGRVPVGQAVRALVIDAGTDLALLEMPVLPEDFPPLHFFQLSNSPAVTGEHLHTFGHPGQYDYSTRDGRVSFPSRPVSTVMPNLVDTPAGFYLIEVGFLAPPGFSGGPMINTAGHVVSVNHCIEHGNFNYISLSIPALYVRELVDWHAFYPNHRFARFDGALEYPLAGLVHPVEDLPIDGIQIEGVGAGEAGVAEDAGDDAGGVATDFILDLPTDGLRIEDVWDGEVEAGGVGTDFILDSPEDGM